MWGGRERRTRPRKSRGTMPNDQTRKDISTMVAKEFQHQGFKAHTRDVSVLTDALEEEEVEYDDVAIMAACKGYILAKRG
jgi:hypothetical protein